MKRESPNRGRFYGSVKTDWLTDHPRDMRLMAGVTFIDPRGLRWYAEEGAIINGASTGWFLRRLFPAFVGRYRRATVLHDCYCTNRVSQSWQVHRMFHEAMLCDGTHPAIALIMWAAVRTFGPRF